MDHLGATGLRGKVHEALIRAYQDWYASYQVPVHPAIGTMMQQSTITHGADVPDIASFRLAKLFL